MRRILDSLGTVAWMGMDICWMNQKMILAQIFMLVAVICLAIPPLSKQEYIGFMTTLSWILMNSFWMTFDQYGYKLLDTLKNFWMGSGILGVIFIIISDTKKLLSIRRIK